MIVGIFFILVVSVYIFLKISWNTKQYFLKREVNVMGWIVSLKKRYVGVQSLRIQPYLEIRSYRDNLIKMRSLGWACKKKKKNWTQTCTQRQCHVRFGVMLLQANEPPEARRKATQDPSLEPSKEAWLYIRFDFGLWVSRTVKQ